MGTLIKASLCVNKRALRKLEGSFSIYARLPDRHRDSPLRNSKYPAGRCSGSRVQGVPLPKLC
ncbi:MAG TPA: hypothetical protein DCL60_01635 [Armatimonadetes bacterium]|nr:hypothetical protein [Armatimonadota bacterium]